MRGCWRNYCCFLLYLSSGSVWFLIKKINDNVGFRSIFTILKCWRMVWQRMNCCGWSPFLFFFGCAHGMWDLSSPNRDQTCTPCIGSAKSGPLDPRGSPTFAFKWSQCLALIMLYGIKIKSKLSCFPLHSLHAILWHLCILVPKCVVVFPTPGNSETPAGCPTI